MSMFTGSLDQTVDLIAKGIEANLAESIEKKFHEQVDPLIRELAVDYAKRVTAKIYTMQQAHDYSINLSVVFNDKNIHKEVVSKKFGE